MDTYVLINNEYYNLHDIDGVILGKGCLEKYYEHNMDKLMEMYPSYMKASYFSEGRLAVEGANDKWGFLDRNGKVVCPCIYSDVFNYQQGVSIVNLGGKYGVIDYDGNLVIPCVYNDIDYCSEEPNSLILVDNNNKKSICKITDLTCRFNYVKSEDKEVVFDGEKVLVCDNMLVKCDKEKLILYQFDTKKKIVINNAPFSSIWDAFKEKEDKIDIMMIYNENERFFPEVNNLVSFDTGTIYKALRKIRGI